MGDNTFPPMNGGGYNNGQQYQNRQNQGGNRWGNNGGSNSQGGQGNGYGGGSQGGNRGNYNGGGQGGGWQKKPWQGKGGGGGWQKKNPGEEDLTLYKPFAVTGNRNPPHDIIDKTNRIVKMFSDAEYTLRTGGLEGIEEIAENLATKKEVHLPFKGFREKESRFTYNSDKTKAIAKLVHPVFDNLKPGAQTFVCKDVRLIIGNNGQSTALFLVVWTEDGAESMVECTSKTGFSVSAIRLACMLGIPVFNLSKSDVEDRLKEYMASCKPNFSQSNDQHAQQGNRQQDGHSQEQSQRSYSPAPEQRHTSYQDSDSEPNWG